MSGFPRQHCPHCWGDCRGTCLLPGVDGCIHQAPRAPLLVRLRAARTRRFWRRVVFGARGT